MRKLLIALALLSGCYLSRYPVTPAVVEASTFLVITNEGTGTGFAVNEHTVITAGHVCIEMAEHNEEQAWLKTGRVGIAAKPIAFELTGDQSGDLCVMHTDATVRPGLVLADREPAEGAALTVIGYPHAVHAVSAGVYLGHDMLTAASAPGNSGSAVFQLRGVVGVLVEVDQAGHALMTPVKELRRFLDELGVSYDITPPEVPGGIQE